MPLPIKRPTTYLLGFLLLVLVALVFWLNFAINSPEVQEAVRKKRERKLAQPIPSVTPLVEPAPTTASTMSLDPMHQSMADELHAETTPPERDLEIIRDFITIYGRAAGGNPVGDNADITAALTGTQYPGQRGQVFPRGHRAIRSGELIDRWGTPYWFHPNSGSQMEIRSAGPDRQLFTQDDVVLNPSPAGFGASLE
jgi:hypothetical protein